MIDLPYVLLALGAFGSAMWVMGFLTCKWTGGDDDQTG